MSSPTLKLKNSIYRAGAGAGKTTTLVKHVLDLASEWKSKNDRFPQIVVTTFTRKATQELRERIILEARNRGDEELIRFANSKGSLFISTIHGVLQLLLKRYSSSLEMDSNFQLVDGVVEKKQLNQIIRNELFDSMEYIDLLEEYNISEINNLVRQYYKFQSEFPKAQFYDVKSIEKAYLNEFEKIALDAKNLSLDILNQTSHEKWMEYAENLKGLSHLNNRNIESIQSELNHFNDRAKKPRKNSKNHNVSVDIHSKVDDLKGAIKNLLEPQHCEKKWEETQELSALFQSFADRCIDIWINQKLEQGQITMSDLESLSLLLLRKYPDVVETFSSDWDYWLIDEYQDTSPVQVQLLKLLVNNKPHFIVGDPQQSIYFFRGARERVFQEKLQEISSSGGDVFELRTNYRSCPELLCFLNDFLESMGDGFQPMEPFIPDNYKLNNKKSVAEIAVTANQFETLGYINKRVSKLLSSGVSPENICVIVRTNKQLKEVAQSLQNMQIPVHMHSASGFNEKREILDSISILKFLSNPYDNKNLLTLLRSPWFFVEDEMLVQWIDENKELSLWTYLNKSKVPHLSISHLNFILQNSYKLGISKAFKKALVDCGIFDFCHKIDPSGRRESNIWKLIVQLKTEEHKPGFNYLKFIQGFSLDGEKNEQESEATSVLEPNRVNVMTIHVSKGLQFDHVIVPFLEKAPPPRKSSTFVFNEETKKWTLPIWNEDQSQKVHNIAAQQTFDYKREQELQEQDRLFYVALTRAKQTVSLVCEEEFKKLSWRSRINWSFDVGRVNREMYSFDVIQESYENEPLNEDFSHKTHIRPLYKANDNLQRGPISATQLAQTHSESVFKEKSAEKLSFQMSKAQEGVFFHRILEAVHYHGTESMEIWIEKWFPTKTNEVLKALDYVFSLKDIPIKELITNGYVEWGFTTFIEGYRLEGQIDLWGIENDKLWIVDYKTGHPRYSEKAFEQLKIYAKALRKKGITEPINLVALYPFHKKTIIKKFDD